MRSCMHEVLMSVIATMLGDGQLDCQLAAVAALFSRMSMSRQTYPMHVTAGEGSDGRAPWLHSQ
jgi:hypothetical protein